MKKIVQTIVISISIISGIVSPIFASELFSDIQEYYQYANEITYLRENDFVDGFSDGTFKPENKITRAELTKMVINAKFEYLRNTSKCPMRDGYLNSGDTMERVFPDIPVDHRFVEYICMVKENKIVKGFQNGEFKPDQEITFGEAAKIIIRTLDDEHNINTDAGITNYINKLEENLSIPPSLNSNDKDKAITRGEVAFLIQTVHEHYLKLLPEGKKTTVTVEIFKLKKSEKYEVEGENISFLQGGYLDINCESSNRSYVELIAIASEGKEDQNVMTMHLEQKCFGMHDNEIIRADSRGVSPEFNNYKVSMIGARIINDDPEELEFDILVEKILTSSL